MGSGFRVPQLVLSTSVSRLRPLSCLASAAADAGMDGLDLDLGGRRFAPRSGVTLARAASLGAPVRAVWLPPAAVTGGWRAAAWRAATVELAAGGGGRVVVRLPNAASYVGRVQVTAVTEPLRHLIGSQGRVAVCLPSRWLVGGRAHLVQLGSLRRLAEEWDFDLALDLTGTIDPQWEAEAAVLRLGRRVVLLRVAAMPSAQATDARGRLTARALVPALESGMVETIVLAPSVAPWHLTRAGIAAAAADIASQVRSRQARCQAIGTHSFKPPARFR